MKNKRYFVKTNAYNCMIITARDDQTVAAMFDIDTKEGVENYDCSNIWDMTADEIRNEYPSHLVEGFDPDSPEIEDIEEVPPIWYAVMKDAEYDDWGTGSFNREEAIKKAQDGSWPASHIDMVLDTDDPIVIDRIPPEDIHDFWLDTEYNNDNGEKPANYWPFCVNTDYTPGNGAKYWALMDGDKVVIFGEHAPENIPLDERWAKIDRAIEDELGFLPEYSVN